MIERQKALINALHRDLTTANVKCQRTERTATLQANRLTRERDEARAAAEVVEILKAKGFQCSTRTVTRVRKRHRGE